MKTYVSKATGERYPEHGCASWFTSFSTHKGRMQVHIKPGYKDCTNGWKMFKPKQWTEEIIPDLPKPYTDAEWKEYALKYGKTCAQEFLECCDYSKPSVAHRMLNPPKGHETWDDPANNLWFESVFKMPLIRFAEPRLLYLLNTYSFDIIRFEQALVSKFKYNPNAEESLKHFMTRTFGQAVTKKFMQLFLGD